MAAPKAVFYPREAAEWLRLFRARAEASPSASSDAAASQTGWGWNGGSSGAERSLSDAEPRSLAVQRSERGPTAWYAATARSCGELTRYANTSILQFETRAKGDKMLRQRRRVRNRDSLARRMSLGSAGEECAQESAWSIK